MFVPKKQCSKALFLSDATSKTSEINAVFTVVLVIEDTDIDAGIWSFIFSGKVVFALRLVSSKMFSGLGSTPRTKFFKRARTLGSLRTTLDGNCRLYCIFVRRRWGRMVTRSKRCVLQIEILPEDNLFAADRSEGTAASGTAEKDVIGLEINDKLTRFAAGVESFPSGEAEDPNKGSAFMRWPTTLLVELTPAPSASEGINDDGWTSIFVMDQLIDEASAPVVEDLRSSFAVAVSIKSAVKLSTARWKGFRKRREDCCLKTPQTLHIACISVPLFAQSCSQISWQS